MLGAALEQYLNRLLRIVALVEFVQRRQQLETVAAFLGQSAYSRQFGIDFDLSLDATQDGLDRVMHELDVQ